MDPTEENGAAPTSDDTQDGPYASQSADPGVYAEPQSEQQQGDATESEAYAADPFAAESVGGNQSNADVAYDANGVPYETQNGAVGYSYGDVAYDEQAQDIQSHHHALSLADGQGLSLGLEYNPDVDYAQQFEQDIAPELQSADPNGDSTWDLPAEEAAIAAAVAQTEAPAPPPPGKHRPSSSGGSHKAPPPIPDERLLQELQTVRYYLKQAMEAKDAKAIKDLVAKARNLSIGSTDDLVTRAEEIAAEVDSNTREQETQTIRFYLKQAMETKSHERLKLAIAKADAVDLGSSRKLYSDFISLVTEAKKMLLAMDVESAETLAFYLKQGIATRSRDILKETCAKAMSLKPGTIDPDLVKKASELLKQLDAENLMLFYLDSAVKQKDTEALEITLQKADALGMQNVEGVKHAREVLKRLQKKKRNTAPAPLAASGSRFKSIFGGGNKDSLNKKKGPRVFGAPLTDLVASSRYLVPEICYDTVEYIRKNGMTEPGLFRISGNADTIEGYRLAYEQHHECKFEDVNDAAGLLKQYLRSLPEPLVPFAFYKDVLAVAEATGPKDANRSPALRAVLSRMPRENLLTLAYLCFFLHDLSKNEKETRMNASNIAIVFAPNLLKPAQETHQSMITELPMTISIVSTLVEHVEIIFDPLPASLLKTV